MSPYIGTAGWNLPSYLKEFFPEPGTHLERYSKIFNAVEINSSFYRNHKPDTYNKWAASVPKGFRFSVKLLKDFIHVNRFQESGNPLKEVIEGICCLKEKLDVLLVQLPPSLDFEYEIVKKFIEDLRQYYSGGIAWEPRHITWSCPKALELLNYYKIIKVCADPEPCPVQDSFLKNEEWQYYRLHGTPEIYKSRYGDQFIENLSIKIKDSNKKTWCVFDNTTFGYATENAIDLKNQIEGKLHLRDNGGGVSQSFAKSPK